MSEAEVNADPRSLLFVCTGNICRSPAGEGVMRHIVAERQLADRIRVDSAGTISFHVGELPDPRMVRAAAQRGYSLASRARQIQRSDLDSFDLIVAMDRDHMRFMKSFHRHAKAELRLLSAFLKGRWPKDVPDPYYGGVEQFELVLDMIEAACPNIIDHLLGGS